MIVVRRLHVSFSDLGLGHSNSDVPEWMGRTQNRQNNCLCSLHYVLTDTCTMASSETMPQGESKTSNRAQLPSEQAEGHARPAFHPLLPPQQGLAAVLAASKRVSTLKVSGPRVHSAQGLYIIILYLFHEPCVRSKAVPGWTVPFC